MNMQFIASYWPACLLAFCLHVRLLFNYCLLSLLLCSAGRDARGLPESNPFVKNMVSIAQTRRETQIWFFHFQPSILHSCFKRRSKLWLDGHLVGQWVCWLALSGWFSMAGLVGCEWLASFGSTHQVVEVRQAAKRPGSRRQTTLQYSVIRLKNHLALALLHVLGSDHRLEKPVKQAGQPLKRSPTRLFAPWSN